MSHWKKETPKTLLVSRNLPTGRSNPPQMDSLKKGEDFEGKGKGLRLGERVPTLKIKFFYSIN